MDKNNKPLDYENIKSIPVPVPVSIKEPIAGFIILFIFFIIVGIVLINFFSGEVKNYKNINKNTNSTQLNDIKKYPALSKFPDLAQLVSGQNNDTPSQVKLRYFDYYPYSKYINVDINGDQNLTNNMTKDGIHIEVSDIYYSLFHVNKIPLDSVDVSVYMPLVDQYGNSSYQQVYSTTLTSSVAKKINWNEDKSTLELSTLPENWTVYINFQNQF